MRQAHLQCAAHFRPEARAKPDMESDATGRHARWWSSILVRLLLVLLAAGPALLTAGQAEAAVPTSRTNIDTNPTGAQVYLVQGTQEVFQGNTPMKLFRLPRGAIQLKFKKDGYEDLLQTVTIGPSVATLLFNLQRSIKPATIELTSAGEFASAAVEINGKAVGVIPVSTSVPPGRHQVVVSKDGYQRWERWIEATEGQKVTFDVVLAKIETAKGEILVTSSPTGASVVVNGQPRGVTPTVVEGLVPGPYLVEVTMTDYLRLSQTVNVESGKRAIFDAPLQKEKGETGELKVLVDQDDADIFVNGEKVGKAPLTLSGFKPGTHFVEARNERGFYAESEAVVKAGESTLVRLRMTQTTPPDKGSIRVISTAPSATVSLDGSAKQPLPATFKDVSPGSHIVSVEAPGYAVWQRTVTVERGQTLEVVAELGQAGRLDVVTKDGRRAELFLNGRPIGRTPFTGDVPAGTHTLLVQREDGKQEEFQIAVGVDREVKVTAAFGADAPKPATINRPMPFSARAMSQGTGHASIIVSYPGWPFPLAAQAGGGIGYGMDINVQVRSAFDVINEFEAIYKWSFVDSKTLAAAVELGIGGGLGGSDRNSFFFRPAIKGSLMVGQKAAITARLELLYHTDRLGPEDQAQYAERDSGLRLYLGLDVEFEISKTLNLLFQLSGDPVGGKRDLYEESFLDDPDPKLYFKGGVSFLF